MRFLLDTHVWLWMLTDPGRLRGSKALIEDGSNELLLSAVSSWEIAIKHSIGRLPLPEPPTMYVPSRIKSSGVTPLAISHAHALQAAELPLHHRDPFDRLLIGQAISLQIALITADSAFAAYAVELELIA